MGMKARPPEFAFFGAGGATYFEWAEVHVRFAREPTPQEQQKISKRVPPPLTDSIGFTGTHLMVSSGQFAHVSMATAYPGKGDPSDESQWDGGRWFFADSAQVDAFNLDTEAWLREAHAVCPIVCAYRAEDWESGGTELSVWHHQSMRQIGSVLAQFEEVLTKEKSSQAYMLAGILRMAKEAKTAVPEAFLAWSNKR